MVLVRKTVCELRRFEFIFELASREIHTILLWVCPYACPFLVSTHDKLRVCVCRDKLQTCVHIYRLSVRVAWSVGNGIDFDFFQRLAEILSSRIVRTRRCVSQCNTCQTHTRVCLWVGEEISNMTVQTVHCKTRRIELFKQSTSDHVRLPAEFKHIT